VRVREWGRGESEGHGLTSLWAVVLVMGNFSRRWQLLDCRWGPDEEKNALWYLRLGSAH
jgi:hypothetical protein